MLDDQNATQSYREEIEAALNEDTSRIGDVFRATLDDENKTARSIADELGMSTVGQVYSHLGSIKTLIEGKRIFEGTTYVAQKARMLRSFSKRHADMLSEETRRALNGLADEHEEFANNEELITHENEEIERALEADNSQNVPGIYVYTYPHYNRSPVLPSKEDYTDDRTFLKVGVTEAAEGASKRIQQQIGEIRTALPESPLILRIYDRDDVDLKKAEKQIQRHLEAADHNRINRQRGSGVGTEWFLTHLKFLDSTADLLGLEVKFRHPDGEEE